MDLINSDILQNKRADYGKQIVVSLSRQLADNTQPAKTIDAKEIAERQAMFESLRGCLAGQEIDLKKIREERLQKRGLL